MYPEFVKVTNVKKINAQERVIEGGKVYYIEYEGTIEYLNDVCDYYDLGNEPHHHLVQKPEESA